jgi:hypothetical protein
MHLLLSHIQAGEDSTTKCTQLLDARVSAVGSESTKKMLPCGGTSLLTVVNPTPMLLPLQTSTALAELWPSPSGAITAAMSMEMFAGRAAPLMASAAVLPSAMGFRHSDETGPAVFDTPTQRCVHISQTSFKHR